MSKFFASKGWKAFVKIISYIFSFFIPVIGTGMWFFYRKSEPKKAKLYLILCILGFIVNYTYATWLEDYTGIDLG